MTVNGARRFEKKNHLWFGGIGIVGILISKMGLGQVVFDDSTRRFSIKKKV